MASPGGKIWSRASGGGSRGRGRGNFLTRTATDDAAQLLRRASISTLNQNYQSIDRGQSHIGGQSTGREPSRAYSERSRDRTRQRSKNGASTSHDRGPKSDTRQLSPQRSSKKNEKLPKGESVLRPVGGTEKLDTYSGVFVPTSLNVLSILMFIRFGFVLGQAGVLGTMAMLLAAYVINLVTTFSISAVASNGTVRGGGAYYLISRSLGPEFGGSIGIVSYLGFVFNTGMNAVGLVDCVTYNFGSETGIWSNWLPEGGWWPYLWSTVVVVTCVAICLAGSAIFARASGGLLLILMFAIISIPVSAIFRPPFLRDNGNQYTDFTGFSLATFKSNLLPHLTKGAAGSQLKGRENYQDLFGILFPATGGIFAGASMSGDLKNPSKSIPRGTLAGILLTFVSYTLVIFAMAASITRATFYQNVNVVQDVNLSGVLVLLGEIATTFFSVLMGIIGPARQLQAIARDGIFPGLSFFGRGIGKSDGPVAAIFLTWLVAQFTILFDINSIASLVTMTYLMMSFSLHVACLLLKLSSAPNFRPSFRFFNQWTALLGALLSIASMFFVDGRAASASIAIQTFIFLIIHYTTPPKSWGSDVTSGLVYHQVRKYLLRLKTEHVKYWRPQILLFVNDPRRGYKLISFANSLKKGGLFILGHVIVTDNFGASVPEARRQQAAWTKFIDYMKIKSFVNVAISPSMEWGARNIILSAGLGGMRPNIIMMGFYNLQQFRKEQPLVDIPSPPPERKYNSRRLRSGSGVKGALPTDSCYIEKRTDMQSYVLTLEDMILKLKINVAVAVGFDDMELPNPTMGNSRRYIDLWPIQMSAEIEVDDNGQQQSIMTTNFDTYTLILQLGCILNTVPAWKKCFKLRVAVFVEYESDVEEERSRVKSLLESLRIQAEVLVFWLASGDLKSYNLIVNGQDVDEDSESQIDKVLEDEDWWRELRTARGKIRAGDMSTADVFSFAEETQPWPTGSFPRGREGSVVQFDGLRRILQDTRSQASFGRLSRLGVSLNIRTHRLDDDLLSRHASHPSGSDESGSDSGTDVDSNTDGTQEDDVASDEAKQSSDEVDQYELEDEEGQAPLNQSAASGVKSKSTSKKSSRASSRKSKSSSKKKAASLHDSPVVPGSKPPSIDVQPALPHTDEETRGRRKSRDTESVAEPQRPPSPKQTLKTPSVGRHSRPASPNFSSAPVPLTKIMSDEGQGPSIMFADEPHPKKQVKKEIIADEANARSIYQRGTEEPTRSDSQVASGYPAAASVPLSFNELPCRAQHLILNELMTQVSDESVVLFTTLPAPAEGTYKSESNSLSYLTDLEVLTQGLGPTLLVHSNSMTVTTNL